MFHAHSLRIYINVERDFGSELCYFSLFVFPSVAQCLRCLPLSIAKGLLLALLDPAFPSHLYAPVPELPQDLCLFPWVTSHSCSHRVIPTALPWQTHCCGGGSRFFWGETSISQDWPLQASVSHPLAVVADWPMENHGWLHKPYRPVSTQHSVRTSISADSIICRNNLQGLGQVSRSPGTLLQGKWDVAAPERMLIEGSVCHLLLTQLAIRNYFSPSSPLCSSPKVTSKWELLCAISCG